MRNKPAKLKSIEDIPKDMTEEEAAEFYSAHDLGDIWDELESFEESIELSPELQKTMVHLRLEPRYLATVRQLAKRKGVSSSTLIRSWVIDRVKAEAQEMQR